MPVSGRRSSAFRAAALAACAAGAAVPAAAAEAPRRVVSINVCTDQIAMTLAADGQLHSVSFLAADPRASAMAAEAADYPLNHARAEEIFLMKPDLVLAGTYQNPATLGMLRRLGIPVETFAPATSLDAIRETVTRIGALLGRDAAAADAVADFDAGLAALGAADGPRLRAALYFANGYTVGRSSLSGDVLDAAGFANVADAAGFGAGGRMPLEVLAFAAPDEVVSGERYPAGSRSEEILDHPVVRALRDGAPPAVVPDAEWLCGTPHVLAAVARLARVRRTLEAEAE